MKGKITCDLLNVRKTPEVADNVIDVLEKGTELLIIDHENGWMRIQAGDTDGYVMDKFVTVKAQETPEPGQDDDATGQSQGEIDENGNFIVDGKAIGHVEGDEIVITDPNTIENTLNDAEAQGEPPKGKPKKKEKGGEDEQTGATE